MLQCFSNSNYPFQFLNPSFLRQAFCMSYCIMSEMLGNHYFLSRNYAKAIDAFSKALGDNYPDNILKKLIICHITQGNISIAKEYFFRIITKDPYIIINTNITDEDCPCPEIISYFEKNFYPATSLDDLTSLGILWLYCDMNKSIDYFNRANQLYPKDSFTYNSLNILNQINLKKKD